MAIFNNFSPTSSHLDPLQVENCDSNSRLVVDEDDNGKFRPERVNEKDLQELWDNARVTQLILLTWLCTGVGHQEIGLSATNCFVERDICLESLSCHNLC